MEGHSKRRVGGSASVIPDATLCRSPHAPHARWFSRSREKNSAKFALFVFDAESYASSLYTVLAVPENIISCSESENSAAIFFIAFQ